jgi:hypothetical protein
LDSLLEIKTGCFDRWMKDEKRKKQLGRSECKLYICTTRLVGSCSFLLGEGQGRRFACCIRKRLVQVAREACAVFRTGMQQRARTAKQGNYQAFVSKARKASNQENLEASATVWSPDWRFLTTRHSTMLAALRSRPWHSLPFLTTSFDVGARGSINQYTPSASTTTVHVPRKQRLHSSTPARSLVSYRALREAVAAKAGARQSRCATFGSRRFCNPVGATAAVFAATLIETEPDVPSAMIRIA